jgi:hypothetical protein
VSRFVYIPGGAVVSGDVLFFLLDEWKLAALLAIGKREKLPRKP